jgi:hypothetical protein
MTGPRIDSYRWSGGCEPLLRFGPEDGRVVVAVLPLFEEANRVRAFAVAVLRALAERDIGGLLPELPGTGESMVETADARLADLQAAFAAAAPPGAVAFAIRSGALIDIAATLAGRWHLAPQDGSALLRELGRIAPLPSDPGEPVEVAGNLIAPAMLTELRAAQPLAGDRLRTVRLAGDPRAADRLIDRPPLWRRNEPSSDPVLVQQVVDDIANWTAACAE